MGFGCRKGVVGYGTENTDMLYKGDIQIRLKKKCFLSVIYHDFGGR